MADQEEVEVIERNGPRRKLASVVSVRFSPDELALLRAALPDGNLSQFVRRAALAACAEPASSGGGVPLSWSSTSGVTIAFEANLGDGMISTPDAGLLLTGPVAQANTY